MSDKPSKTKTSFYRRIYLAHLINSGVNTVPAIIEATGMPRRTAQDTLLAMKELGIDCEFIGATKDGHYRINDWGAINIAWVEANINHIKDVLQYP